MRPALRRGLFSSLLIMLTFPLASCDSSGSNGSESEDFNQVTIQSVTVKELDFEDPSADDPNGPDIFVFFREAKTGGETKKSDVKEDMDLDDLPLKYSTSFKVGSNDFDQTLDIEISEHDDDDRRRGSVIGSVRLEDWDPYVAPYGSTPDEYPETITLEDERDGTKCTLELKWGK